MENEYRVALYCRLSEEDRKKYNDIDESESIQNQKLMLLKYIKQKNWKLYDIYWDDDYSGMDSKRPAWNQLLKDAENKKFDIIVCKTQSRFTRDMEMVEKYLNYKFLLWGIRFIAVLDNIDTDIKGGKKSRQINGLVNQWYVEDTSESVKSSLKIMREEGKYISATPLYGYVRDKKDKSKLVIDPEASLVVKRIFYLYDGKDLGAEKIADILNKDGILPPAKYKKEKQIPTYNHHNMCDFWSGSAVRRILKNRMYVGDMVQGTTTKPDIKSKKTVKVPKEKWVIVSNTHEAIISREVFMRVQDKFATKKVHNTNTNMRHLFSGKLFCLNCGSIMQRRKCHGVTPYYRCKYSFEPGKQCFNIYRISYESLYKIILFKIKEKIDLYCDFSKVEVEIEKSSYQKREVILGKQKEKLQTDLEKKRRYLTRIYEDRIERIISEEEYRLFKSTYDKEVLECQRKIDEIDFMVKEAKEKNLKELMNQYKDIKVLDKKLINAFVDKIKIGAIPEHEGDKQIIEIYWNF